MTLERSSPGKRPGTSHSENSTAAELLTAVEHIRPIVEECAAQSEAQRSPAPPVFDAMRDTGPFRTLMIRLPPSHFALKI